MILTFNFWWQSLFATLVLTTGATYLAWRAWQLYSVSSSGWVAYLFLILEAIMYFSSIIWFIDMLWTENKRRGKKIMPIQKYNQWPTVDIFVPCCKEPTDLVKDTVLAALWQDYPAERYTVYICDDGGDEALRTWAENEAAVNAVNVRYVRRVKSKDRPHHAKAGNVNHALSLTSSEYVAILDADMLVGPKGDPLGHMASFFYESMLPHRDTRNSAPSVGTGVIFRRKALEQIGGISTGTLTEDFDTSIKLQRNKWETVYIGDRLQYGLIPDDLESTLKQRERWAIGTLQIMIKRNLLFGSGLSWHQRIMYFSAGLSYILPVFVMIFSALPVLALFFNWSIMPVAVGNTSTLVFLLVPYLFCTRLLIYVMYWNVTDCVTARNRDFQLFLWMAPFLTLSLGKFLLSGIKTRVFTVTNAASSKKSIIDERLKQMFKCWYHVLYIAIAITGLFIQASKLQKNNCVSIFSLISQVLYVLLNVQSMAVPVLYILFPPKPVDRRSRLKYNEFEVPQIIPKLAFPEFNWTVWLLEVVPFIWAVFYLCIFIGFASGFRFGCSPYFFQPMQLFTESAWQAATKY